MDILIFILIIIILICLIANTFLLIDIVNRVFRLAQKEPSKPEEAKVTDPFTKPKEIYSSTSHIVVPKTPTEIRNQNFNKIKEGIEYGDIARG